jgi:hypothetical protein
MDFAASLSTLTGIAVKVSDTEEFPEPGAASVRLRFEDGSMLRADYWRLFVDGKAGVSSFDHQQKYGLPQPIDSALYLQQALEGKRVADARLDAKSGDLLFCFDGEIELQVINVTGYEVWEFSCSDGTGEYSNHVRPYGGFDQSRL